MKIVHTTISVANLDKSLAFYKEILDAEPKSRFQAGPNEIAFIGDGESKLELIQGEKGSGAYKDLSIGIATKDVYEKRTELERKGFEVSKIFEPNPKVKFFFIKDPDGLDIQFISE